MGTDERLVGELVDAMYDVISGPAGPRDWARERELFHPDARMMRTSVDEHGASRIAIMSTDAYAADVTPFLSTVDFYEVETARRIQVFGNIAQIWSVYEARHALDDPVPQRRGINSIQAYRDHTGRWWIMSMLWDNERPGLTVPPLVPAGRS